MSGGDSTPPPRPIRVSDRQAQRKFAHASPFGVRGRYNLENRELFKAALVAHVNDPATEVLRGTYRRGAAAGGFPAVFYLNRSNRLIVVVDRGGNFVTGFRLTRAQLWHVETSGKLGGAP